MAGLPGAGKSTLARQLGHDLGWYVLDKDGYRGMLLKQGVEEEKAGIDAYERSFAMASDNLARQVSVILDSAALHNFILARAKHIVNNAANAQLKVILCVADRDLRNDRLRKRPAQFTAIRVDPATIADYLQYFKHLPADTLTLYTNKSIKTCLAIAKDYLKS